MTAEELLDRMSSWELSAWLALDAVEAEEAKRRKEDPEGYQAELTKHQQPAPGVLVRIHETETDEDEDTDPLPEPD